MFLIIQKVHSKGPNYPKNDLEKHIFLDLTKRKMSDDLIQRRLFKFDYKDYTLKVWK